MGTASTSQAVDARLVEIGRGGGRYVARCGSCGQSLWVVDVCDGVELQTCLLDSQPGWRFDAEARVWRPTEKHLAQRRAARERIRTGRETPSDRSFLRSAWVDAGRRGKNKKMSAPNLSGYASERTHVGVGMRFGDTARLPVVIQCQECGKLNSVADPGNPYPY